MATKHRTKATMFASKKKSSIGIDFENFLQEQGQLEESTALAMQRVLTWQFNEAMKKSEIAQLKSSR